MIGDMLEADVGIVAGGFDTLLGLAFSSEPGSSRSISRGDCPEKLGLVDADGSLLISSNRVLRLFVTLSGSNLGRGSSRINGGVLMSNIEPGSNWRSAKGLGDGNCGGLVAVALNDDSCMPTSSVSADSGGGVEVEASEAAGLVSAATSDGLFVFVESIGKSQSAWKAQVYGDAGVLVFGLGGVGLLVKVVSSKALHLKSFLYPPHVTLLL